MQIGKTCTLQFLEDAQNSMSSKDESTSFTENYAGGYVFSKFFNCMKTIQLHVNDIKGNIRHKNTHAIQL